MLPEQADINPVQEPVFYGRLRGCFLREPPLALRLLDASRHDASSTPLDDVDGTHERSTLSVLQPGPRWLSGPGPRRSRPGDLARPPPRPDAGDDPPSPRGGGSRAARRTPGPPRPRQRTRS